MDKTYQFTDRSGTRRGSLTPFVIVVGALTLAGCFFGVLIGGCTDTAGTPVVATAAPVTSTTPTTKATAQASFDKFIAKINAINANVAKDNGSPAQQQLLFDASGAALAGAIAATSEGTNSGADVAALAGAVKALSDIAQLPSVQSTKSAQVKQAVTLATGAGTTANALAPKVALIYDAATAQGANPKGALLAISQGLTQAQAQAAAAAVAPVAFAP